MAKKSRHYTSIFTLVLLLVTACSQMENIKTSQGPSPANFVVQKEKMLDPTTIDTNVSACDDFYEYACGNWLKNTTLADEYPRWTRSFNTIDGLNLIEQRKILDKLSSTEDLDSDAQKLRDYYAACNDLPSAENAFQDLRLQLIDLDQESTNPQLLEKLPRILGELHLKGVPAFFTLYAGQDEKNAIKMIANIDRNGLSLASRGIDPAYYTEAKNAEIRAKYLKHIENIFLLANYSAEASQLSAQNALEVETLIAKNILTIAQRRDPELVYNKKTFEDLTTTTPRFAWNAYIETLGTVRFGELNVVDEAYMPALNTLLEQLSAAQILSYLKWQLLNNSSETLGAKFVSEHFNFFGKTLLGQQAPTPRWRSCVEDSSKTMTDIMGRKYVETQFSPQAKEDTTKLTLNIRAAFEEILKNLEWMDEETKLKAIEKLNKISQKIGYPDKWDNYNALEISRSTYFLNKQRSARFHANKNLKEIDQPTDRSKWFMTAATVNAYYNPNLNEIVFPAGILATPFYDTSAPAAANYGAIGMVIGHEITHGFDDQGRQYDGDGNLKSWWSDASAEKFKERASCVVKQYSSFQVDGNNLKGDQTLGENTADLGGIKIAYAGFLKANPEATPEDKKNFFLAFAQGWCTKARPEFLANQIQSGVHSPAKFRVNGPLVNLEVFSEAYSCSKGTPMNPENKCAIW